MNLPHFPTLRLYQTGCMKAEKNLKAVKKCWYFSGSLQDHFPLGNLNPLLGSRPLTNFKCIWRCRFKDLVVIFHPFFYWFHPGRGSLVWGWHICQRHRKENHLMHSLPRCWHDVSVKSSNWKIKLWEAIAGTRNAVSLILHLFLNLIF